MFNVIDKLFGRAVEPLRIPPPQPAPPRYSIADPRHWTNDGWHRSDLPQGRRFRRIEIGDAPRAVMPFAEMTAAEYVSGGHVADTHVSGGVSARGLIARCIMIRR